MSAHRLNSVVTFFSSLPKKGMRTLDVTQSEEQTIRGKYKKKEKNKYEIGLTI